MFGRPPRALGLGCLSGGGGEVLGGGAESLVASAAALMARPAPRRPPAAALPFRKVRRLSLLSSARSMSSMRALILGPAVALGLGAAAAAAEAQSGPSCAPARLNNSALQGGSVTVSPLAGSRDASPQTQISFLGVPP